MTLSWIIFWLKTGGFSLHDIVYECVAKENLLEKLFSDDKPLSQIQLNLLFSLF